MLRTLRTLAVGTLAATVAATLAVAPAGAQAPTVRAAANVGALPYPDALQVQSFGWFFTPSSSFVLTGVFTRFADLADAAHREVTIDLHEADAVAPTLGARLAQGSFHSSAATQQWGGASFAGQGITLAAGTRYFVGFRNVGYLDPVGYVGGLGANFTGGPTGVTGAAFDDLLVEDATDPGAGPYAWHFAAADAGDFANPLLQLEGTDVPSGPPPVTTTPEPATVALLGAGLAGLVLARRRAAR